MDTSQITPLKRIRQGDTQCDTKKMKVTNTSVANSIEDEDVEMTDTIAEQQQSTKSPINLPSANDGEGTTVLTKAVIDSGANNEIDGERYIGYDLM